MNRAPLYVLLALSAACSQRSPWRVIETPSPLSAAGAPASSAPAPASSRPPSLSMVAAAPRTDAAADATAVAHLRSLLFPVGGSIDSTRYDDSFDAPRDGGVRKHNAVDIMAPRGAPVLAVADGRILQLRKNAKGGLTVYASDLGDRFVYYYAHLDRYHPKVYGGKPLMRGDTLGFVGTTGNSPKDLPHLHFQVMRMPADGRYVAGGEPINPFPLLQKSTDK